MAHSHGKWSQNAIREIGTIVARQRTLAFPLAATLGTQQPIWFADERRKFAGSHKVHLVASRLDAAIRAGRVAARTPLVLDSCGTTALTLALMANAIGARCRVYCPLSTARVKLIYLRQNGVEINLVASLDAAREAARADCAGGGGVHVDQFCAAAPDAQVADAYGAGLLEAVTRASGRTPTDVLTCVGSGGTLVSLVRAVAERGAKITVHVVDLPDGRFARRRGGSGHSVDGLNQEFTPECIAAMPSLSIVKASEPEAFAAAVALRDACGEAIGLTSGLVLAGALALRETMRAEGRAGLICVPIYDTGERYPHKLRNRDFLDALGDGFEAARARYAQTLDQRDTEQAA